MRLCPACADVPMLLYSDPQTALEIDSCPECRGLWFDGEELKLFFQSAELAARVLEDQSASLEPPTSEDVEARRLCPVCRAALFGSRLDSTGVDYCLTCRGIWLDRFEIDGLVSAHLKGQRGNLLIANQLIEGLGTRSRPNPEADHFLGSLERYRRTWQQFSPSALDN